MRGERCCSWSSGCALAAVRSSVSLGQSTSAVATQLVADRRHQRRLLVGVSYRRDAFAGSAPEASWPSATCSRGGNQLRGRPVTGTLEYRVDAINTAQNFVIATGLEPGSTTDTAIAHDYPGPGPFRASWPAAARSATWSSTTIRATTSAPTATWPARTSRRSPACRRSSPSAPVERRRSRAGDRSGR